MSIINLPSNFVASTTAVMSALVNDLSPYILLVVGVILAVVIVEVIINALRPK